MDSLYELTLSRGIGLAKNPLYTQCLVLQVDKLCRDMPNKAVAELDRLHDRTVNPVFASYEHRRLERNVAIHWRLHHHYLPARKRKLGKYTTMIGNIGSDNFIGRKLKTG